jgi:hydrogenase-4 transcriptional activator
MKNHGTGPMSGVMQRGTPSAEGAASTMELELAIWREACRHLDIEESLGRMLPVIARFLPVDSIAALRLDAAERSIETVAVEGAKVLGVPPGRVELEETVLRSLVALFEARVPVAVDGAALFDVPVRAQSKGRVLLAPLLDDTGPAGFVVLHGERGFDDDHVRAARSLIEPLGVALANDRRVHELARLREAVEAENRALLTRLSRQSLVESIIGERGGLRALMERVSQVALTDVPVLLLGETGSGKEVIARAIHERSRHKDGPMVRVNCGAIPTELVDSELFGHERGSFTGAIASKKGWFERADGGTLLLDEVGELPLAAQVRLLRILQEGTLERVGGQKTLRVHVRIVAATHRDLHQMVEDGRFREDLWYRLGVFPLRLPSLRERREDIPLLATQFAARAGERLGAGPLVPTASDVEMLVAYPWPGNVRELAAVIERAAILGHGRKLDVEAALGAGARSPRAPVRVPSSPLPPAPAMLDDASVSTIDQAMTRHIERALEQASGRIEGPRGAAAALGINPHTLRSRMRKLGIHWARFRA